MAKRGRPAGTAYRANLVKTANERLRKMEKIHAFDADKYPSLRNLKFTDLSRAYRDIRKYATEQPNGKGKIYRETSDGGFRFIGKKEYEKLSQAEKRYFDDILNQFLENQTSMKVGVIDAYKKSYDTFIKKYEQYADWSFEDYMNTWKTYSEQVAPDRRDKFQYDQLTMLITTGNFNVEFLTHNQAMMATKYNVAESNNPFANKAGKLTYQHRTMADEADRKPRNRY